MLETNRSEPAVSSAGAVPPSGVEEEIAAEVVLATQPPRGLAASFRSLRHRNYRLYFIGQLISLTGTWMQTTALTWLAYDLTHQSKWPALISAAQMLPTLFLGVWGGLLADRWPKRSLILLTQFLFLILAVALAILVVAGAVQPWQLLLIALGNGLVQAIDLPARLAFVMDMVGRDDLMNAVALNSLLFNVARAAGPATAGALLDLLGPGGCFLINAVSYLAVLWALWQMTVTGAVQRTAEGRPRPSLSAGFRYLVQHPRLGHLILLTGITAFCAWPFLTLLPALAKQTLAKDANGYSLMVSGTGFGALAAAWAIATFGTMERRRKLIGLGIVIIAGALLGLSFAQDLVLAIACSSLAGFGLILFFATGQSVVQLSTEEHNRGQIMGIWAMMLSGAVPLGSLIVGPAADEWGVPVVIFAEGLGCAGAALYLFVYLWIRARSTRSQITAPQ